jgi:hypothetical protein
MRTNGKSRLESFAEPPDVSINAPSMYHNIEKANPQVSLMELGVTGLKIPGGYVHEEYLPQLYGGKAIKVYKEMSETDDTVGAILFAIEMTLRSVPWQVVLEETKKGNPESESKKEWVRSALFTDMEHSWPEFITEVLSMLPYGWSYFEIIPKRRLGPKQKDKRFRSRFSDGAIGIRKLAIRSQDTLSKWQMDEREDEVLGMWQILPKGMKEVLIPRDRSLLFRAKNYKNNPEGHSVLRTAYKQYHFKTTIEMTEAISIEREMNGVPMVRIPSEVMKSTQAENVAVVNSYIAMAKNIRFNHQAGILIPSDPFVDQDGKYTSTRQVDFELIASKGTRSIDTGKVIERKDRGIARCVMADFLMMGTSERGSYALSTDKTRMFTNALEGWLNVIAEVCNRQLLPFIWDANGWDYETMPMLQYGKVDAENIAELAKTLSDLARAGMPLFPDPELEQHVRNRAGWPDRNDMADYGTVKSDTNPNPGNQNQ